MHPTNSKSIIREEIGQFCLSNFACANISSLATDSDCTDCGYAFCAVVSLSNFKVILLLTSGSIFYVIVVAEEVLRFSCLFVETTESLCRALQSVLVLIISQSVVGGRMVTMEASCIRK
ncbi:unnamed protein product [Amoebophrya sp. A25]|nr:unnamed protein product [Amoebophrya sp. A25]|eukprot:GSA25T00002783001.1